MSYKILETHLTFNDEKLTEVAVLWDDNGFVRATYSTSQQTAGYAHITPNSSISMELFQEIAGYGIYVDEVRRKKYFPGKRKWSK